MKITPEQGARPRAVLYLRQSVAREESISLEVQETSGRTYCAQQGYDVVAVESDPGISGRTWNRPAVQRVMTMIETGAADVVILWKWSRLSRSRLDWAVAVDKGKSAGGRIESATESVNISTSTGRLARGMLAEFAAFESERIGDTWKQAHERRVKQGRPANGKPRFGYAYNRENGFTPDPETGPVLATLYRRYLAGESIYKLVHWLNDSSVRPVEGYGRTEDPMWAGRAVRRVLDSGFAAGYFTHRGDRLTGIHEALISEAEWQEYQARRKTRAVNRRTERSQYLLSGLIRCFCGSSMHAGLFGYGKTPKYRCRSSYEKRNHTGGYVMASVVDQAVYEWLEAVSTAITEAARNERQPPAVSVGPSEVQLNRKLLKLTARLENLTVKYADHEIGREMYERVRTTTATDIESIEHSLRALQVDRARPVEALVPDLLKDWDSLQVEVKRDILSRLIHPELVWPGRPRAQVVVKGRWEEPPRATDP